MNRAPRAGIALAILVSLFGMSSADAAAVRPVPVKPEHTRPPEVRIWDDAFRTTGRFMALDSKATGGGHIAAGDIDGDGNDEIVVGSGLGAESEVRIFDVNGKQRLTFAPYLKGFKGGVRVAVGDVIGDSKLEIVTAPGPGTEANIRVFDANGNDLLGTKKLAYAPAFVGGVHLAVGNLVGDSKAEIVTSPGPGGGPHVRVWNGSMENVGHDIFAFTRDMTDGVTVSIAKTEWGPTLVAGVESWSEPLVRLFIMRSTLVLATEFYPFDRASRRGITTAAVDMDGNGIDEIAVTGNGSSIGEVALFDTYGNRRAIGLLQDPTYRGGMSLAAVKRAGSEREGLAVIPASPVVIGPTDVDRSIDVNLTQQRLYAYERGRIAKTFLVSTGTYSHPTPVGKTTVQKKIPIMDYRWSYGPGHPDNYNLKNVKFNLNVFPHIYIHTAYWHNNFGYRMSHGCINTHITDAEWIFNWASTGTQVEIHY
ncbi:MAG: L,D-transpeptidase family protein [Patescibacteria group bacterium]|jgi:hypothetical protein